MIKREGSHIGFGGFMEECVQFQEVCPGCEVMGMDMLLEGKSEDFCQI